MLDRYICSGCTGLVNNARGIRCGRCGLSLGPRLQAFGWTLCRHCKPAADNTTETELDCVVCCDYTPPFDQWIAQLKYGKAHGLAQFLGQWLGMSLEQSNIALPDLLIPVPSSTEKLKSRGYNQAALIARHAGRYIKRPVANDYLIKVAEAGAQAELSRAQRLRNLEGAFRVRRPIPAGLRIGLIDDVITTGATLKSCELTLRKAGAKSIVLLAVCRTPE